MKCKVCLDLDFDQVQPTDENTEKLFGNLIYTNTLELENSRENGCQACSILSRGIHSMDVLAVSMCSATPDTTPDTTPVRIRLRQERSLEIDVGDQPLGFTLEFYVLANNPTIWRAFGPAEHVSPDINLKTALHLIQKWMRECSQNHPSCLNPPPCLPTRVVDISMRSDPIKIKLVESGGQRAHYTSLSHCWGQNQIITTVKSTRAARENGIPWSLLSKTFQDAIQLTRELGIRYIWIDSLCIIQDDSENWESEASKMSTIYTNSFLNIAATRSSDGDGGCFSPRTTYSRDTECAVRTHELKVEIDGQSSAVFVRLPLANVHVQFTSLDFPDPATILRDAPLLSRAWAVQERLLAPRTVHFHSSELVWECKESLRCECTALDDPLVNSTRLRSACTEVSNPKKSMQERYDIWLDIVTIYSRLKLTKPSDKLPALFGLAAWFNSSIQSEYLAGIWRGDIARALLWQVSAADYKGIERPPAPYRPPSWSWSSIAFTNTDFSGFITYDSVTLWGFEQDAVFRLLDPECTLAGRNSFKQVSHRSLTLRGLLISPIVVHDNSADWVISDLILDRDGDDDFVLVDKEALDGDMPICNSNEGSILDGEVVYCLLLGHTTRAIGPEGKKKLYDLALALEMTPGSGGMYERIGILQCSQVEDWFSKGVEKTVVIAS